MTTDVMLMKVTLNVFGGSGSIQVREKKRWKKAIKIWRTTEQIKVTQENVGSKSVSEKLCTYPPLTKHLSRYQLSVVELGKKKVGNCSATNNDPKRFKMVFRATSFFFVISRRL